MPATTKKPNEQPAKVWDRKDAPKYVRCELSKDQKSLLASWASEQEDADLLKWIEGRISSGHVLSLKSQQNGYQVSLTGDREASGHFGVSLVARGSTPIRSLFSCWYKDELVLQGVWPSAGTLDELDY